MKTWILALATAIALGLPATAAAQCDLDNDVPLTMLSNSFEAWKIMSDAMTSCGNFEATLDADYRLKINDALAADPAVYTMVGVSNATLTPLLADGLVRPLDDLVEAYGQDLLPSQLIRVDGEVVAISMMVNAQHLMYRSDVLDVLGLEVPETYPEVLTAAEEIAESGLVDYPLVGTFGAGWNLGEEFVNMYLGYDTPMFTDDNRPNVANADGVAALEMLAALGEYMDPEYLSFDSTAAQQKMQQGQAAMTNLWATRAAAMDDPEESEVGGLVEFAAAPAAFAGGAPATTLWWDGISIASNVTDAEAEAAFQVLLEGIDRDVLAEHPDAAIWLSNPPIASDVAVGAQASAEGGAPAYPSSNLIGIMHNAAGEFIPAYLNGETSAEETLAAMEDAYLATARENGLID